MPEMAPKRQTSLAKRFASMTKTAKRIWVISLCAALLFVADVSTTFAFHIINDNENNAVLDTFTPAAVTCTVDPDAYTVTNTSNIPVYVRARFVINWVDTNGYVHGTLRYAENDFSYFNYGDNWEYSSSEDIFYYTRPLVSNHSTTVILNALAEFKAQFATDTVLSQAPASGLSVQIQIVAEAIQADGTVNGTPAVENAWGNAVTAVDENGILTIQ